MKCDACKEPIEDGQLYLLSYRRGAENEFSVLGETVVHHQCPIHVIVQDYVMGKTSLPPEVKELPPYWVADEEGP